jgi:hypothetical protein
MRDLLKGETRKPGALPLGCNTRSGNISSSRVHTQLQNHERGGQQRLEGGAIGPPRLKSIIASANQSRISHPLVVEILETNLSMALACRVRRGAATA